MFVRLQTVMLGLGALYLIPVTSPNAQEAAEEIPSGERPRIQYWLRDPVQPVEAQPETIEPVNRSTPPIVPVVTERPSQPATLKQARKEHDDSLKFIGAFEARSIEERRMALQGYFKAQLKKAEEAYKMKDYERTAAICRNILTADPRHLEAIALLEKAHGKIADGDTAVTRAAAGRKDREAILEAEEHSVRPPVKASEIRPRLPQREDDPERVKRLAMEAQLEQRVTVDFVNADLEWVMNTLFALTGVNIFADPAALEDKTLTLHVGDTPLRAILDFIVRTNEGIQYSVTPDGIMVTASEGDDLKKLMYIKTYPLRHGLTSTSENDVGASGSRGGRSGGSGAAPPPPPPPAAGGSNNEEPSHLETALKWLKDQASPQVFPEGSDYLVDRPSNKLIVFTTPMGHKRISAMLDELDQPPIQVLIKTRFLEVSRQDNSALGINIDSVNSRFITNEDGDPVRRNDPRRAFDFAGNLPNSFNSVLGNATSFKLAGLRTDPQFSITLNALLNNKNTKILSEPSIIAINNKMSVIDITTEFSYIEDLREVTTTDPVGNGTAVSRVSAFVPEFGTDNVGFTLNVTPSVGRDLKTINLHIQPVIDSLAEGQQISQFQTFSPINTDNNGNTTPPTIQRPTIDQTRLSTDVVLEDNGYVILGGLIRNRMEERENKIPGLHKIPVVGDKLFTSKSKNRTTSNLIIIVEAQIMTPRGRNYHTPPFPDDADAREGGVNRVPMQVTGGGPNRRPKHEEIIVPIERQSNNSSSFQEDLNRQQLPPVLLEPPSQPNHRASGDHPKAEVVTP